MTNVERQILLNQTVIMTTMTYILRESNGSEQDIENLVKCATMTSEIINSQSDTTNTCNVVLNGR